nr:HEAT repeat domain-containing protein [Bacteroidota bacterium]
IYHGGEPHYKVAYRQVSESSRAQTVVDISQIHEVTELVGYFRMPVVVEVHYKDGTYSTQKEWVDGAGHRMAIPNEGNKEVAFVLFDPGNEILKTVTFEKQPEELMAQALGAPLMIDRYDALVALRATETGVKRDALIKIYDKETFHATKAEIISQLAEDEDLASIALIAKALQDKDHRVRLSAVENVKIISPGQRALFESLLKDSSYVIIEKTLVKLCSQFPSSKNQYLAQTNDMMGLNRSLRITWLALSAGKQEDIRQARSVETLITIGGYDAGTMSELIDYTSPSYEFRTRNNAFEALKSLNHLDDRVIANLFDAMLSFNSRLANPAGTVLAYFYQQSDKKAAIDGYFRNTKWEPWQEDILRKHLNL